MISGLICIKRTKPLIDVVPYTWSIPLIQYLKILSTMLCIKAQGTRPLATVVWLEWCSNAQSILLMTSQDLTLTNKPSCTDKG